MDLRLEGKIAIVTGAKGNLGSTIQHTLEKEGVTVHGFDIDDFDLRDREAVAEAYKDLDATILVNNAGVATFDDSMERKEEDFDLVVDTNLKGTYNSIRSFVESLSDNYAHDGGSIINIGSIYGMVSPDFRIYEEGDRKSSEVYGATKAGVIQMTRYFAVYLAERYISVNCVSPGGIQNVTDHSNRFSKKYTDRVPMGTFSVPMDTARLVAFLASPDSWYITGQNIAVDGG